MNKKETTLACIAELQKIKPLIEEAYNLFIEEAANSMTLERLTEWRGCFSLNVPERIVGLTDGFQVQHYANLVVSCKGIVICETSGPLFGRDDDGNFMINLEVDYRKAGLTSVPHDLALLFVKEYEEALTDMISLGETKCLFNVVHMAFRDNQPIAKVIASELASAIVMDGWKCSCSLIERINSYYLEVEIT